MNPLNQKLKELNLLLNFGYTLEIRAKVMVKVAEIVTILNDHNFVIPKNAFECLTGGDNEKKGTIIKMICAFLIGKHDI